VQEVAEELGLMPFRVHRLEVNGLRILRHPELSGRLKWHNLCYFERNYSIHHIFDDCVK
jgi:hypothetical protein